MLPSVLKVDAMELPAKSKINVANMVNAFKKRVEVETISEKTKICKITDYRIQITLPKQNYFCLSQAYIDKANVEPLQKNNA